MRLRHYRQLVFFFLLGVAAFLVYWFSGGLPLSFLLIGPPIYIATVIRGYLPGFILNRLSHNLNVFCILLPVTLFYFTFIGFHLHSLKKQQGWLKRLSLAALLIFFLGVHILSWLKLNVYYIPHY